MFTFCKPISSKKRFSPLRKLNEDFSFTLFENAKTVISGDWDSVTLGQTIFLEKEYLSIIEKCTNNLLRSRYVIVYSKNKPCGIIYFQIVDFRAEIFGDLLTNQTDTIKSKRLKLFENYIGSNKDEVLMRLFTCGNNLISGDYGFLFSKGVKKELSHELVIKITETISKEEKLRGAISAILFKDFNRKLEPQELFENENYTDFFVEPNLIVDIPPSVKTLNDYTQLFSKKYRNRSKSILKSGELLERKNFSFEEIKNFEKDIYKLYESVYEHAKFKLLKLPSNYFSEVKKHFQDSFYIYGFFLDKKLVAFSSYFLMPDDCLEAHYIGFDYELNHQYNLYQNILYSNISAAIQNNKSKVNLGRTAAEIKTTVGAKAVDLICYTKPQNTISKLILKPFISFLQPGEWTPRNPFKEDGVEDGKEKATAH
jgi:hypothetical protein